MAKDKEEGPLSAEALARDKWRGDETQLKHGDAPGHTLPESESEEVDEKNEQGGPRPFSGTMLPPD